MRPIKGIRFRYAKTRGANKKLNRQNRLQGDHEHKRKVKIGGIRLRHPGFVLPFLEANRSARAVRLRHAPNQPAIGEGIAKYDEGLPVSRDSENAGLDKVGDGDGPEDCELHLRVLPICTGFAADGFVQRFSRAQRPKRSCITDCATQHRPRSRPFAPKFGETSPGEGPGRLHCGFRAHLFKPRPGQSNKTEALARTQHQPRAPLPAAIQRSVGPPDSVGDISKPAPSAIFDQGAPQ
jgi:hypothetical protein